MNKKVFQGLGLLALLCMTALTASAQWSLGIKGGWDYTSITRSNAGRIDETYSPLSGYDAGIQARYGFTDWFALRADLSVMRRSHRTISPSAVSISAATPCSAAMSAIGCKTVSGAKLTG